jgi:hypothetical protein
MKKQGYVKLATTLLFVLSLTFGSLPLGQATQAPSAVWVIETAYSASYVTTSQTSLALDHDNNPHISFTIIGTNGHDAAYTVKSGGVWTAENVQSLYEVGTYSSLALDSHGTPHMSFSQQSPSTHIYYASKSGSGWTSEVVVSHHTLIYSSLELDSSGSPHISYLNNTNSVLMYATKSGTTWTSEVVDSEVMGVNSLLLDSAGNPHISYFDKENSALKYATKSGTTWIIEPVDNDGNSGRDSSIALDSDGNPHISYYGPGYLKYASKSSAGIWTTEIVDHPTGRYVGWHTSLAIDSNDNPHISYYSSSGGDLKYATKSSGTWAITTVDTVGTVGEYNSLALDSNNMPHISYFDRTNRDLKYASLVSTGPVNTAQSIPTATGSGTATFTASAGTITNLNAIAENTLTSTGIPAGMVFPDGFFSFNIEGLSTGQSVTVDIVLPSDVPIGLQYWKYQNGGWTQTSIGSDDGDNVISITLTDGGAGDSDGAANGVIADPGGPAYPNSFVLPEYTLGALIALIACFAAFLVAKKPFSTLRIKKF